MAYNIAMTHMSSFCDVTAKLNKHIIYYTYILDMLDLMQNKKT